MASHAGAGVSGAPGMDALVGTVMGTLAAGVVVVAALPRGRLPVGGARPSGVVVQGWWRRVATATRALVHPPNASSGTVDMVAFLDAVARGVRSGAGLHAALRASVRVAGVHAPGLATLVGSLDAGMPLSVALTRWRGERPAPEVSLAAAVLGFGLATGGSVARAVDGAAATLRERVALAGETQVLATQARVSALVVGGAPVGFTVVVVLSDPRVAGVLFGTLVGVLCLVVGVVAEVACVVWMRRLVAQAAQQ